MQPYPEDYLETVRRFNDLLQRPRRAGLSFEAYLARARADREEILRLSRRNMELLRTELFPAMEGLYGWDPRQVAELEEFSFKLYDARAELDVGLFCQIHQALLGLARFNEDRDAVIRELYWLGMGSNALSSKLVGLPLAETQDYILRMRQYFTEAADYLKDFDGIDSSETRGYILRSRANTSLGQFSAPGEKTRLLKGTLEILQNKHYQELAPDLPWDRFIYLTHQNMASSISHSREKVMSPQEMASIMPSALIVYQGRYKLGQQLGQPAARPAFGYHALEFYCGLTTLDTFLTRVEELLDGVIPNDYSPDGMYAMLSLPAFYSQYLSQYPEALPPREEYLQGLYRRMLDYADACPSELGDQRLFLYLRQLCFTFVETEGGIPYSEFLLKLLLRFAPEAYRHSHIVGEGAQALCAAVMENDPTYFDDIDFIREITDPGEKRSAVLDYAMDCGLFHDAGKMSVIELCSRTARQWLDEEYELGRLHTLSGRILLEARASTRRYAPAALGHHAWYRGGDHHSYPDAYHRAECPARRMVDVISLADWMEVRLNSAHMYHLEASPFDQVVREAVQLGGTRFSPRLTELLRDGKTAETLRATLEAAEENAYRRMYDDALELEARPE